MQEIKNKIEAVLFITGRFMSVEDIAQFCNIGSIGSVKEAIKSLVEDYKKRAGGLEVIEQDKKFKLNIKNQYVHLSTKLLSSAELDGPTQTTLAIIAYKQPALQSEIVKMRGNGAYDHIKVLREMEFVTSERKGRTRLLKLTPKFFEYFDIVEQEMKEKFHDVGDKQEQVVAKNTEVNQEILEEVVEEVKEETEEEKEEEKEEGEEALAIENAPQEAVVKIDADDFGSVL